MENVSQELDSIIETGYYTYSFMGGSGGQMLLEYEVSIPQTSTSSTIVAPPENGSQDTVKVYVCNPELL